MRTTFKFDRKKVDLKMEDKMFRKVVEQWRNAGWTRRCKYRAFSDSINSDKEIRKDYFYGIIQLSKLRSTAYSHSYSLIKGSKKVLLDAGCGRSPDALIAVEQDGFKKAYQIDLLPFQTMNLSKKITTLQQDYCEKWKNVKGKSIDLVVAQATLDLVAPSDRDLFYRQTFKALKENGRLAVYFVNLVGGHGFSLKEEKESISKLGFFLEKNISNGFIAMKSSKVIHRKN